MAAQVNGFFSISPLHVGAKPSFVLRGPTGLAETLLGFSLLSGLPEDADDAASHVCSLVLRCEGEAFTETDQRYLQADSGGNRDDGCTAVTAVIVGNTVVVAHVGDSRAVLAKTGKGECADPLGHPDTLGHQWFPSP